METLRVTQRHAARAIVLALGIAAGSALGRQAFAAADEIRFVGGWKIKTKGGGAKTPTSEANGTATLDYDPGVLAGGEPLVAQLKASRKVHLVDGDGGGVTIRLTETTHFAFSNGQFLFDVSLLHHGVKDPAILLPVLRDASPELTTGDINAFRFLSLPAGDYTVQVKVELRRKRSGSIGEVTPSSPPFAVTVGP